MFVLIAQACANCACVPDEVGARGRVFVFVFVCVPPE